MLLNQTTLSLCRHVIHKQPDNVLHLLMSSSTQGPTENELKPLESVTSGSAAITTLNLPDSEKTTGDEEKNSTELSLQVPQKDNSGSSYLSNGL